MVLAAAAGCGVPVDRCAVIGDIGADVEAARAAGAHGRCSCRPPVTRPDEVAAAPCVAPDFAGAVDLVLGTSAPGPPPDARVPA